MTAAATGRRLAVVVLTYRRPELLAALLEALPPRVAEVPDEVQVDVVVVDNDPDASARTTTAKATVPVRYVHEPTPGIAAARARALAACAEDDLLAFIDDDERPREGWLPALVATWEAYQPAAVMGRVISVFPEDPDPWIIATGVFSRRPRPTGQVVPTAASGNLLLDLHRVRELGVSFDPSLGLSGGEDSLFSRQLVARGGTIVWCNESEVEDLVPQDRLTRAWAMSRAFNGGTIAVRVDLSMTRQPWLRPVVRAEYAFGGCARAVFGCASHLLGRLLGDLRRDARGLRTAYRGLGMVNAALGRHHAHYERTAATSTA